MHACRPALPRSTQRRTQRVQHSVPEPEPYNPHRLNICQKRTSARPDASPSSLDVPVQRLSVIVGSANASVPQVQRHDPKLATCCVYTDAIDILMARTSSLARALRVDLMRTRTSLGTHHVPFIYAVPCE